MRKKGHFSCSERASCRRGCAFLQVASLERSLLYRTKLKMSGRSKGGRVAYQNDKRKDDLVAFVKEDVQ